MSTGLNTHLVTWGAVGDFENALGGTGNDTITGTSGANNLSGNAGNDTITGGGGNDSISGGSGNDTITTTSGADFIDGGDGNDTIDAGAGNNILVGGLGDDSLTAGSGNDTFQNFFGAFGHDTITDTGGSNDILNLSNYAFSDVLEDNGWLAVDSDSNGKLDQLVINLIGGDSLTINNYFDNSASTVIAGSGCIETLDFSGTMHDLAFGDVQSILGL